MELGLELELELEGVGGCQVLGSLNGCRAWLWCLKWYARYMRRQNLRNDLCNVERVVCLGVRFVVWWVGVLKRPYYSIITQLSGL